MSVELSYLVASTALLLVQVFAVAISGSLKLPLSTLVGNREEPLDKPGYFGRIDRAFNNLLQAMVMFAPLVLAVELTGQHSELTALGAMLFFYARIGYFIVYTIGIPWVRSAVWGVALVGNLMLFAPFV